MASAFAHRASRARPSPSRTTGGDWRWALSAVAARAGVATVIVPTSSLLNVFVSEARTSSADEKTSPSTLASTAAARWAQLLRWSSVVAALNSLSIALSCASSEAILCWVFCDLWLVRRRARCALVRRFAAVERRPRRVAKRRKGPDGPFCGRDSRGTNRLVSYMPLARTVWRVFSASETREASAMSLAGISDRPQLARAKISLGLHPA